jgi:hypothetical protein
VEVIVEITREEFESYGPPRPSFFVSGEVRWFRNEKATLLGAVIIDPIDKDYSFVVLQKVGKKYEAVDMGISKPTEKEAVELLKIKLSNQMN